MYQFGKTIDALCVFYNKSCLFAIEVHMNKTTAAQSNIKRYLFCEPDKFPH